MLLQLCNKLQIDLLGLFTMKNDVPLDQSRSPEEDPQATAQLRLHDPWNLHLWRYSISETFIEAHCSRPCEVVEGIGRLAEGHLRVRRFGGSAQLLIHSFLSPLRSDDLNYPIPVEDAEFLLRRICTSGRLRYRAWLPLTEEVSFPAIAVELEHYDRPIRILAVARELNQLPASWRLHIHDDLTENRSFSVEALATVII